MLGNVRGKYSSIPIPNSEITLNGADLLSAAQTEKDALIAELKEMLDSMSRQSQLERKQAEAEAKLLSTLMDNSTDAFQVATDNGKLIYMNKVGLGRLGLQQEQIKDLWVRDYEKLFETVNMPYFFIGKRNFLSLKKEKKVEEFTFNNKCKCNGFCPYLIKYK
jgi:signal transduction histidine kinase